MSVAPPFSFDESKIRRYFEITKKISKKVEIFSSLLGCGFLGTVEGLLKDQAEHFAISAPWQP